MNKNLKDRADKLLQSVYLDGYDHGYKDALQSLSNIDKIMAEILDKYKAESEVSDG